MRDLNHVLGKPLLDKTHICLIGLLTQNLLVAEL